MPWRGRLLQYECGCGYTTKIKFYEDTVFEQWAHNELLKHKKNNHTEEGRARIELRRWNKRNEKQNKHQKLLREHARLKAEKAENAERLKAEAEREREREIARLMAERECLANNESNQTPIATLTDDAPVFKHICQMQ